MKAVVTVKLMAISTMCVILSRGGSDGLDPPGGRRQDARAGCRLVVRRRAACGSASDCKRVDKSGHGRGLDPSRSPNPPSVSSSLSPEGSLELVPRTVSSLAHEPDHSRIVVTYGGDLRVTGLDLAVPGDDEPAPRRHHGDPLDIRVSDVRGRGRALPPMHDATRITGVGHLGPELYQQLGQPQQILVQVEPDLRGPMRGSQSAASLLWAIAHLTSDSDRPKSSATSSNEAPAFISSNIAAANMSVTAAAGRPVGERRALGLDRHRHGLRAPGRCATLALAPRHRLQPGRTRRPPRRDSIGTQRALY